jgi:hypothetical protein
MKKKGFVNSRGGAVADLPPAGRLLKKAVDDKGHEQGQAEEK